ncbi:MAG: hypothetical protein RJA99_2804 [Pseudomonadota bacterium]|jgi:hypothetical protein
MTSVSRILVAIGFAAAGHVHAAPLKVALPCDRPMLLAGEGATLVPAPQSIPVKPVGARLRELFIRACGPSWSMREHPETSGRLAPAQAGLEATLRELRPAVAVFDFPHADLVGGATVDALLARYASLMRVCAEVEAVCLVGGQRPVDTAPDETAARQQELERRAREALGRHYLPLYLAFRSEAAGRRAIVGLVAGGEPPRLTDLGHEVLFTLYRNRLLEMTAPPSAQASGARPAPQAAAAR